MKPEGGRRCGKPGGPGIAAAGLVLCHALIIVALASACACRQPQAPAAAAPDAEPHTTLAPASGPGPSPAAVPTPAGQGIARYIGLAHPPLPAQCEWVGGALLEPLEAAEFGIEEVKEGSMRMLWFERMTHRDSQGRAHWEVIDVIEAPPMRDDERLVMRDCLLNGARDTEIVALAEQTEEEFHTVIRSAWRANRRTGRFEVIDTAGIRCENADYGV